jgi:hypothetical protein
VAPRPAFQHQGPDTNCVVDGLKLGWLSCTAYAMAMLIDASTDGARRPKGCRVRRLVAPENVIGGLTLSQVARVADDDFDVPIQQRTPAFRGTIPVDTLARRISRGRGFVLQGNNSAFAGRGTANHAIYVHEARGGTAEEPKEALVYDPQRLQAVWIPWRKIVAFGEALRPDEDRPQTIPPGRVWAGFGPPPAPSSAEPTDPDDENENDDEEPGPGVDLEFGATARPHPLRLGRATPPGRRINVRDTPRRLTPDHVVRTLGRDDPFLAFQKVTDGAVPPGAQRGVWFGNRSGRRWVHRSGVRATEHDR